MAALKMRQAIFNMCNDIKGVSLSQDQNMVLGQISKLIYPDTPNMKVEESVLIAQSQGNIANVVLVTLLASAVKLLDSQSSLCFISSNPIKDGVDADICDWKHLMDPPEAERQPQQGPKMSGAIWSFSPEDYDLITKQDFGAIFVDAATVIDQRLALLISEKIQEKRTRLIIYNAEIGQIPDWLKNLRIKLHSGRITAVSQKNVVKTSTFT